MEVLDEKIIDFNFAELKVKFGLFVDEKNRVRAFFDIDSNKKVKSGNKTFEPFVGKYYINNLFSFYKILFQATNNIFPISPYVNSFKDGNEKFSIFRVRAVKVPSGKRKEVFKKVVDSVNSRVKEGQRDLISLYGEKLVKELFEGPSEDDNNSVFNPESLFEEGQVFEDIEEVVVGEKEIFKVLIALSKIKGSFNKDVYSFLGERFISKNPLKDILAVLYPEDGLIFEFKVNKNPVRFSRLFLSRNYLLTIKELIEDYLKSLMDRATVVNLCGENGNGNGITDKFLLIEKENGVRKVSSLSSPSNKVEVNEVEFRLLSSSLREYSRSGIPYRYLGENIAIYVGTSNIALKVGDCFFKIKDRDVSLNLLFSLF